MNARTLFVVVVVASFVGVTNPAVARPLSIENFRLPPKILVTPQKISVTLTDAGSSALYVTLRMKQRGDIIIFRGWDSFFEKSWNPSYRIHPRPTALRVYWQEPDGRLIPLKYQRAKAESSVPPPNWYFNQINRSQKRVQSGLTPKLVSDGSH